MSFCENPIRSSPKYKSTNLSALILILDVIMELQLSNHTVLTGESSDVLRYDSSLMIILDHIFTG